MTCVAVRWAAAPGCTNLVMRLAPLPWPCAPPRRFFEQQPLEALESGREGERRLLYWLVEDGMKKR